MRFVRRTITAGLLLWLCGQVWALPQPFVVNIVDRTAFDWVDMDLGPDGRPVLAYFKTDHQWIKYDFTFAKVSCDGIEYCTLPSNHPLVHSCAFDVSDANEYSLVWCDGANGTFSYKAPWTTWQEVTFADMGVSTPLLNAVTTTNSVPHFFRSNHNFQSGLTLTHHWFDVPSGSWKSEPWPVPGDPDEYWAGYRIQSMSTAAGKENTLLFCCEIEGLNNLIYSKKMDSNGLWTPLPLLAGNNPSCCFDSDNHPLIAYRDMTDNTLKLAILTDSGWHIRTAGSEMEGSGLVKQNIIDVTINSSGKIGIAYQKSDGISFALEDEEYFTIQIVDPDVQNPDNIELEFDSMDHPFISWHETPGEGIPRPDSIAIIKIASPCLAPTCPADFNHDNIVDFADAAYFATQFNTPVGDFYTNGIIKMMDLRKLAIGWMTPSGDLNEDGTSNYKDMAIFSAYWYFDDLHRPANFDLQGPVDTSDLLTFLEYWLWQAETP